jgi:hypothetical protein
MKIGQNVAIWAEILNFAGKILILGRIWQKFVSLGAEILGSAGEFAPICGFGVVIWGFGVVFGRNFDLGPMENIRNVAI